MVEPVPLAGLGVSQPALLNAVQVASLEELVSDTGSVPPAAGSTPAVGLTANDASASAASAMRMRRNESPLRESINGSPVLLRAVSTALTDALGTRCRIKAHAPATCGAAIDVPLFTP